MFEFNECKSNALRYVDLRREPNNCLKEGRGAAGRGVVVTNSKDGREIDWALEAFATHDVEANFDEA